MGSLLSIEPTCAPGPAGKGSVRDGGRGALVPVSKSGGGFSLVELLAVIAILVVMTALTASSLTGFFSGIGRRGAVNTVVGLLEQARVAALENGTNVHVVFWKRTFPEQDSVMVLRDRTDADTPPAGSAGANALVALAGWSKLGKGVIFRNLGMLKSGAGGNFPGEIAPLITQGADAGEKDPERFFGHFEKRFQQSFLLWSSPPSRQVASSCRRRGCHERWA